MFRFARMTNMVTAAAIAAGLLIAPMAGNGVFTDTAHAATADIVASNNKASEKKDMLNAINSFRASKGLRPVTLSERNSAIAQDESNNAVATENFGTPGVFMRDPRAGDISMVQEISGWSTSRTPAEMVNAWKSHPNYAPILSNKDVSVIGIGFNHLDGKLTRTGMPWNMQAVVFMYGYPDTYVNNAAASKSVTKPVTKRAPVTSVRVGRFTVSGAFYKVYAKNSATLGAPSSNAVKTSYGSYQKFQKGRSVSKIVVSSKGAFIVKDSGAIGQKWARSGGAARLGVPVSNETPIGGGVIQQKFQKGNKVTIIKWAPRRSAWIS